LAAASNSSNPIGPLFAAVILSAMSAAAAAQVPLATVVQLAQRNSSAVHLAQADVNKAAASLSESRDAVIPSLSLTTGVPTFPQVGFTGTPPSIWTATVQSLVFGVPQKHYISSAGFALKSAKANLDEACEQIALDASTDYIELDTVNSELALIGQQEEHANRLVQIEQERAEAGVDPLSDVLEARLTAAQMRLKRFQLEAQRGVLLAQLSALTGLAAESIKTDHSSIPEIPQIRANGMARTLPGIESSLLMSRSRNLQAKADEEINYLPQLSFVAQYNRNTTLLNNVNSYFARPLPTNNFSSGISIQVPIFDMGHHAKARESAADALKSKVEAEQASHQNDVEVARLAGTIRELDVLAEVASLKQQIAQEQLKTVLTQMELGTGSDTTPQVSPKAEQLARIDERQKLEDSLDAGLNLAKARLGLLRALGHMSDWLDELKTK
jgi:outer membrane protein TolC